MRSSTCSLVVATAACGACGAPAPAPLAHLPVESPVAAAPAVWPLPPGGWRAESFPFPLDFAPAIAHRGTEELRFAPGMFDPSAAGYWSYAFAWRLDDAADLTPQQLGDELTAYFRGLLVAVDGDKHRITDPAAITVTVDAGSAGAGLAIRAHVIDAFASGLAVELTGFASRAACGTGSLWVFGFAPHDLAPVRAVAAQAACGQPILKPARDPAPAPAR